MALFITISVYVSPDIQVLIAQLQVLPNVLTTAQIMACVSMVVVIVILDTLVKLVRCQSHVQAPAARDQFAFMVLATVKTAKNVVKTHVPIPAQATVSVITGNVSAKQDTTAKIAVCLRWMKNVQVMANDMETSVNVI